MKPMKLTSKGLPDTVLVGGQPVKINTDFRVGMKFETLQWDNAFPAQLKAPLALVWYYGEGSVTPNNAQAHYNAAMEFFQGGDALRTGKKRGRKPARIIDYDADSDYIYSAFLDQYGTDLQEVDLHWWKFRSMLAGLREDHMISKVIWYRSVDLSKIKGKDRKKHIMEMKKQYAIQTKRPRGDTVAQAGALFG